MLIPTIQPVSYSGSRSHECGCPLLPAFSDYVDIWLDDRITPYHMTYAFMWAPERHRNIPIAPFPMPLMNVVDSAIRYIQCLLGVSDQIEQVIDTSAFSIEATMP